ncbi:MAG: hypothetical protein M3540_07050, partial [Actinomycetota bacterium]|nr:hypothetical protein [Actinomycetota bacterium]
SMVSGLVIDPGTDLWASMADVAARVGAWLYVTEDRTWRVRSRPVVGSIALALTVGEAGTIITSEAGMSREGWANYTILEYRFRDGAGDQTVYGRAKVIDGPLRPAAAGYRMHTETRNIKATQDQADAAAGSVLRNLVTRGRTLTLRAIAAYWLRPGETIEVTLPTGETETHLVRSVSFTPAAGTMDVVTRQPNDATIETGE